jgi:hypothetical protein
MKASVETSVRITDERDAYKSFFDHEWAKTIGAAARDEDLRGIVFDLCLSWKSTANVYRMPWLMPELTQSFYDGYVKMNDPFVAELAKKVADDLIVKMNGAIKGAAKGKLRAVLKAMAAGVRSERVKRGRDLDVVNEMWSGLIKENEFQLSLWATQRITYADIYWFSAKSCAHDEILLSDEFELGEM